MEYNNNAFMSALFHMGALTGLYSPLLTLGACARVTVVGLSFCLSVTALAATYLVCESNLQSCKVPYGVPNS